MTCHNYIIGSGLDASEDDFEDAATYHNIYSVVSWADDVEDVPVILTWSVCDGS